MSNDYSTAWDALARAIGAADGVSTGSIDEIDHLTVDQQLKAAEVAALLSISQEISALNPANSKTRGRDGRFRNGWGFPIDD